MNHILKYKFVLLTLLFLSNSTVAQKLVNRVTSDPSTWIINVENTFDENGEPVNKYVRELLELLSSDSGEGMKVTCSEFKYHLARYNSNKVYTKYLIKYATPHSRHIQKTDHINYAKVFLQEKRIQKGVKFLKKYRTLLRNVEKQYGVARKDIVSILMWESGLGEFTGNLRVFNIFMAQILFIEQAEEYAIKQLIKEGKKYPDENMDSPEVQKRRFNSIRRSALKSLAALLRYSKEWGVDPLEIRGGWGGAIGYTQFMPYRMNVAVDGDGDGKVNLHTWPDAIHSVANYLRELGNYKWDYKKRKAGIYSYNRSDEYVDGVIAYADAIWKRYTGK
ncbi:lytic murein transglycosylase [Bacteroidota bacterium]